MSLLSAIAASIAALLSLGNLLRKGKVHADFLFSALMAAVAALLFQAALRYSHADGSTGQAPILSLIALCGIFVYMLFRSLARMDTERRRRHFPLFLLLIPAALSDVLVFILRIPIPALTHILQIVVGAAVLALFSASFGHITTLYFPKEMTSPAWTVFLISTAGVAALLIGTAGVVTSNSRLFVAMDAFISVIAIVLALFWYRYPGALGAFHQDTVRRRYARSLLSGLDVQGLISGMMDMMVREAPYRDEGCSLETLSRRMGLSVHQVSELLNDRMGTSFSAYVNGYRIEEAKRLMTRCPDMTTLAVAMEVGFGTKSSFYEAFRRAVRMTPRQFRESAR